MKPKEIIMYIGIYKLRTTIDYSNLHIISWYSAQPNVDLTSSQTHCSTPRPRDRQYNPAILVVY